MKRIPSVVQVGCLTYRLLTDVAAIKKESDDADIDPGAEWAAFSDHGKLIIGINPDNPVDVQRRDLLHEVIHCCLRFSGVEPNAYAKIVHKARGRHGGYTVEEFMVAAATGPLLDTLRRSPDLLDFLIDD